MDLPKEELLQQLQVLRAENETLKQRLQSTETVNQGTQTSVLQTNAPQTQSTQNQSLQNQLALSLEEYQRYGRQMIVPEFGALASQLKLKQSNVLVIGAGGLGCPALLYLSAAGIGHIGIVDDDAVDVSNLHRQVLHTTETVGMYKCESAKSYISKLNPHVKVTTYPIRLDNQNAFSIFEQYDLILDCTDAPAVRYLINDVAVILGKTVVSGSGLKTDGQWTILNFDGKGPCYRCFHPKPPAVDSVTSCQDGGVIGPAIGIIGVNMALEAIKVLTGFYKTFKPFMCAFYGYNSPQYRTFKMRGRQPNCEVCGENPTVTKEDIEAGKFDYHVFCGKSEPLSLPDSLRVSVQQYHQRIPHSVLVDVRPKEQFEVASLPGSVNIPWGSSFKKLDLLESFLPHVDKSDEIYVICRFGNDSQNATQHMIDQFGYKNVKDIKGGLYRWSEELDQTFPKY